MSGIAKPPAGDNAHPMPPSPSMAKAPWRRLAVTAGVVFTILLVERIPLPFLRLDALRGPGFSLTSLGVLSLGIVPALGAFALVELAALIIPRWRPLRIGAPEGRQRLLRATLYVLLPLVLLQGWFVGRSIEGMHYAYRGMGDVLTYEGPMYAYLVAVTLAAGVFFQLGLAWTIDRFGLGGGFSVLLAMQLLIGAGELGRGLLRGLANGDFDPFGVLVLVGGVALMALVTVRALTYHRPPDNEEGGRAGVESGFVVRLPSAGAVPIEMAASLLLLPASLAPFLPVARPLADVLVPHHPIYVALHAILVVGAAAIFTLLFHRPRHLASVLARAATPERRAAFDARVVAARRRALGFGLLYFGVLVALDLLLARGAHYTVPPLWVMIGCAVALDLAAEWRARRDLGELVAVWPLHRVWAVEPALAALAAAGIPAHARTAHHRALWHYFAPYLPIAILVRPDQRDAADTILRKLLLNQDPAVALPSETR